MWDIKMIKSSMSDIPEANLRAGFELRVIRADDIEQWEALSEAAFNQFTDFATRIAIRDGYFEDSVWVITDGSKIIATGTAFHIHEQSKVECRGEFASQDIRQDCGYLEYVAALPDYSGMNLGYEITAAVLRKLRDRGVKMVKLETRDYCLAAIKNISQTRLYPRRVHRRHHARTLERYLCGLGKQNGI
ncbi:MAG: GNAT family N-acetyltransferase [Defluviitaleaceae bacterium]|nr:GNAT family N-acetyltransferase [Defluviitaleaceae bacterium]